MTIRVYFNPSVVHPLPDQEPTRAPMRFHSRLPDYAQTSLVPVPKLAETLGLDRVWIKDESSRLGLPSFKILGAWWATYRVLEERFAGQLEPWSSLQQLRKNLEPMRPLTLVAATDGNHGQAIAHIAGLLGFESRIFVPSNISQSRIGAIVSEGADVRVVDGAYEDALARAVKEQGRRYLLIQDVAFSGYERVPRWAVEGYSTIFWEIDDILVTLGERGPDMVVAQIGGGSFAASAVRHYRRKNVDPSIRILGIETDCAACALASMEAGRTVKVPGPHDSIMFGLNCGTLSKTAWPILRAGIDCFVAIGDDRVGEAMRILADAGLIAGETGAAGVACLLELLTGAYGEVARERLAINGSTRVVLISTEGATDPEIYEAMVGAKIQKSKSGSMPTG